MKTFILGIGLVMLSGWTWGQGVGPCPNDPNLLQPYCGVAPSYPQYHHDAPPAYEPGKDSREFAREMESVRKQQRENSCKAECPYDLSRNACERRCEQ